MRTVWGAVFDARQEGRLPSPLDWDIRRLRWLNRRMHRDLYAAFDQQRPLARRHIGFAVVAALLALAAAMPTATKVARSEGWAGVVSNFYHARGETVTDMLDQPWWVEFTMGYKISPPYSRTQKQQFFSALVWQRVRQSANGLLGVLRNSTFIGHWSPNAEVFIFWLVPAIWVGVLWLFLHTSWKRNVFVIVWMLLSVVPLLLTTRFHAARVFVGFPAFCLAGALAVRWIACGGICAAGAVLDAVAGRIGSWTGRNTATILVFPVRAVVALLVLFLCAKYIWLVSVTGLRAGFEQFPHGVFGPYWLWDLIGLY